MSSPLTSKLGSKILARQQALAEQGLLRQRQALSSAVALSEDGPQFGLAEQHYLNFSSNDYLGLSRAPALVEALRLGAKQYGVGSGASPLVTGYSEAHLALETKLCQITGFEAALLFSSGFSANTTLCKPCSISRMWCWPINWFMHRLSMDYAIAARILSDFCIIPPKAPSVY